MAEEHGCQSPEGHRLCANNCGFFGSTTTQDLCSKCYRDLFVKDQNSKVSASDNFFMLAPSSSIIIPSLKKPEDAKSHEEEDVEIVVDVVSEADVARQNRCSVCRKKIGLTGFKCRCGTTFCGTHRYPEKHSCTFDFKTMGREAIAMANPLIKAHKLDKI